jgi:hypothetical protein
MAKLAGSVWRIHNVMTILANHGIWRKANSYYNGVMCVYYSSANVVSLANGWPMKAKLLISYSICH